MGINTFKGKKDVDKQKLRGSYYTPEKLADYLADWAIRDGNEKVLEPSAGDGNFVVSVAKLLQEKQKGPLAHITAIEIELDELRKAENRVDRLGWKEQEITWICKDFFDAYTDLVWRERFNVIIGNPPFIRFQHFNDISRNIAFKHLRHAGYNPTKLANIWVAFVQLSIELLEDGGRVALVVPAELLQVNYAKELRSRLSKVFEHIVIIGFRKLVFPEIQQEVILLLAEGKRDNANKASDIHTIEFEDGEELLRSGSLDNAINHVSSIHSRNGMKWTSLFLSNHSFRALDEAEQSEKLIPLGKLAGIDVGIVTGRNSFFVITEQQREKLGAEHYTVPIIGRTSTLSSIVFNENDFISYKSSHPAYLLNLSKYSKEELPKQILEYIIEGEKENVNKGYKCRIRPNWFAVPSIYVPDAFLFRQIHKYPLLVINQARVASTDTIHRVRFKKEVNPQLLAAIMFNSLTLAWAEVCGRSYGGGVLELEPREAEELPLPYNATIDISTEKVENYIRQGKEIQALDYVDDIVLKNYLGYDQIMIKNIRNAWIELRNRRINRR